jgi:DNA-binding MarR family transcriptional regulator
MLKPGGLRATQLGVMTTIANFGSVTINRLAQMLVMDRTTLTRNLKLLEKQGLIKTTPGEDRRTREVTLTDKGQQVLAQALPLWEKAQERVVKAFGAERWNATMADLSDLVTLVS